MANVINNIDVGLLQQFFNEKSKYKGTSLLNITYTLRRPENGTKVINKLEGTGIIISDNVPFIIEVAPKHYGFITLSEVMAKYVFADGSAITPQRLYLELQKHNGEVKLRYNAMMLAKRFLASYVPSGYSFPIAQGGIAVNDVRIPIHGADYIKGDFIVVDVATGARSIVNGYVFYHTYNKQAFSMSYVRQVKKDADTTLQALSRYAY